jgi:hypothetical protein
VGNHRQVSAVCDTGPMGTGGAWHGMSQLGDRLPLMFFFWERRTDGQPLTSLGCCVRYGPHGHRRRMAWDESTGNLIPLNQFIYTNNSNNNTY